MGIRDKVANAIAEKAVSLIDSKSDLSAISNPPQNKTTTNQGNALVPFNAGVKLSPYPINQPDGQGNFAPRLTEYPVSNNINLNDRPLPFRLLRQCASTIDILQRCIQIKKAKQLGLDWDIILSDDATEKVMREQGLTREKAMVYAREKFNDEISRVKEFWKNPDPLNGLSFFDWLGLAVDEILTIDALAIYPQQTVGGDLLAFQVLDGATIKPLIDDRGFRPQPPETAYQQILYNYPRSNFEANISDEAADGVFNANELAYFIMTRRTTSIYGFSPVERSLTIANIYLRRQGWILAEYTDGVQSEIYLTTDTDFANPDQREGFQESINEDLAGQTKARQGAIVLPTGMKPMQLQSYAERFKDVLDDFLISSIASHFQILPTELGLTPKTGLGGKGHEDGQAATSLAIGDIPLSRFLEQVINNLTYNYLGAPREIQFRFTTESRQDNLSIAQADDLDIKNGKLTLNAARSKSGQSLIESPLADQPMMVVGNQGFFITDDGLVPFVEPVEPAGGDTSGGQQESKPSNSANQSKDSTVKEFSEEAAIEDEMRRFTRWLRKSPTRPFNFEYVPKVYAEVCNKFVGVGDYDSARWYAEKYLA